jgi:hypothetical protein
VAWPLPSCAPEILRTLAAQGEHFMDADELAAALAKKPSGGHWNSGVAVLRNNGLIEPTVDVTEPRHSFASKLFTVPKRASQQVQDSFSSVS